VYNTQKAKKENDMKRLTVILLAVLLALSFASCEKKEKENDSKDSVNSTLSGEVSAVADTSKDGTASADTNTAPVPDEEYVLYKETYTKNDNYCLYVYNDKGHVVNRTWHYTNGETLEYTYDYNYNADGSYNVTVKGIGTDYYEYDANGREVLHIQDPTVYKVTTTNRYDDEGRLVESKTESETNVRSWFIRTYDDKGLAIKEQYYLGDGTPGKWYEFEYDENGRQILRHDYNEHGKKEYENILFEWVLEYDDYGRPTLEVRKDAERGGTYEKYIYEYDEAGGMCKKTATHENTVYEYKPLSQCLANN